MNFSPKVATAFIVIASNLITASAMAWFSGLLPNIYEKPAKPRCAIIRYGEENSDNEIITSEENDPDCGIKTWKPISRNSTTPHFGQNEYQNPSGRFSVVSLPKPQPRIPLTVSRAEPQTSQSNAPVCPIEQFATQYVSLVEPSLPHDYPKYERSNFGATWADFDGDCLNTRHDLLVKTAVDPKSVTLSKSGCSVVHGKWYDPYTDKTFTTARDLDIDHIVPLAYAWAHGAWKWSDEKRLKFANDEATNLLPVRAKENREKGAAGPLEWLPPNDKYQCQYVLRFRRISLQYGLEFTQIERQQMENLQDCLCGH